MNASAVLLLGLVLGTPDYRWEPVGPGGGGTVIAPAVSPHDANLMFCGCDMSGAYRSTDGGRSWTMLNGRQIRSVNGYRHRAWAFSPDDPDVVFCGTKRGFLRSDDRGERWWRVAGPWDEAGWGASAGPHVIRFDRSHSEFGVAAFCDYLTPGQVAVAVTRDGGGSWRLLRDLPPGCGAVLGVAFDRWPTSALLLGCERGVYRSEDVGLTWLRSTRGLDQDGVALRGFDGSSGPSATILIATTATRNVGGRLAGGVYRSTNGGASWTPAMTGLNTRVGRQDQWSRDLPVYEFVAVCEDHPERAYVSELGTRVLSPGHTTIYRTDDAGGSWSPVLYGDPRMAEYNVGPEWLTQDLMWGWGDRATGLAVSSSNPDLLLRSDAGRLLVTRDGGRAWEQCHTPPLQGRAVPNGGLGVTTCWHYVTDPHDPQRRYICYTDIGFFRSTDGGETWLYSPRGSPWTNTFYDLVCDPEVPGRLWAAASSTHDIPYWGSVTADAKRFHGGVVRSEDAGATWQRVGEGSLPDGAATDLWLDPKSTASRRRLLVAVMGHGIYESNDGGRTWQARNAGLELDHNPNVLRVRGDAHGRVLALVTMKYNPRSHEIRAGGLFVSDGSGPWRRLNPGRALWHPTEFAVDPREANVIYVSCQEAPAGKAGGGLWKTTDGGRSWRRIQHTGPAYAPVLDPLNPDRVFHCTYGDGIHLSEDAGATWSPLVGLPFLNTHEVTFEPGTERIYVTTFGGGVWRGTPGG